MRRGRIWVHLIIISYLMIPGCATPTKKEIPTEEIRGRADRAFGELRREETKEEGVSADRHSPMTPIREDRDKNSGAVQVTEGKRPDWVDGESIRYPSSHYLTGVGYDSDRKSAEDKARAEIARIFVSKIDSQTKSYQDYLQTSSHGRLTSEETFSVQDITKVSTQKVLSGVRIAQIYQQSSPAKLYYALAALDRDQSTTILEDRIRTLDREIGGLLDMAKGELDLLVRIKYLRQSMAKHAMREAYDTELRIVSQTGTGIPSHIHFTEIKGELDAILLRDFLIGVSVTGTKAGEVQEALVRGLNQEGFSISEDLSAANVVIRGHVDIRPLDRGTAEWRYVRWRTHFDMVDNRGGSVFGSVIKTGREGHLTLQQAENRAIRKIRMDLTTEIAGEMRRYIFSLGN
jgi:hypothetical protein